MRFSGNVRQVATVTLMCSALIAAGYAPALANNNHHKQHWWEYLYGQVESLSRSLGTLGSRVTGRLDYLSKRVDELAATVAGQASTALSARIEEVASKAASDIAALSTKMDQQVAALDSKLQGQLGQLSQGYNALNSQVSSLSSSVETLAGKVNVLENALQNGGTSGGGRVVLDGNQQKVGDFAGLDGFSFPLVAMSDDVGHSFVLQVGTDRLIGDVYFTGANCTGTAYVFTAEKKAISLAGVKNNVVYVTNANVDPTTVPVMSVSSDFSDEGFCHAAPFTITAAPVTFQMTLAAAGPFLVK
jgi:hypothetical protein